MGNLIREKRKEKGWTIRELSERVGTSDATISRLETNQVALSQEWLSRFASAFGVSADQLIAPTAGENVALLGIAQADQSFASIIGGQISAGFPAEANAAIKLAAAYPPFEQGDYLVGKCISDENSDAHNGAFVFGVTQHEECVLGRWIADPSRSEFASGVIHPVTPAHTPASSGDLKWVAVLLMRFSYYGKD